jgi:hypothetical protein
MTRGDVQRAAGVGQTLADLTSSLRLVEEERQVREKGQPDARRS